MGKLSRSKPSGHTHSELDRNGGRTNLGSNYRGHALPLLKRRFWCCAQLRVELRKVCNIRDDHAAIGTTYHANRICKPGCQQR